MNRTIEHSKPGIIAFLVFCFFSSYSQHDDAAIADVQAYRKKQMDTFRDPNESPLTPKDLRKFKGLNYFPIDLKYRVKAKFVRNETPVFFKMKTTTTRLPDYVKYGEVHFLIDDKPYKLEVYQSPDIMKRPGYEDYLFIPFTDLTNGFTTYDVGRYLEMRIPDSEDVLVDFNKAYNPYCSYSPNYSCPIPPEVNNLPVEVPAGEKIYKPRKH